MGNLWTDPFGRQLARCGAKSDKKEEEKAPPAAEKEQPVSHYYYPYYYPNQMCAPMFQQNVYYHRPHPVAVVPNYYYGYPYYVTPDVAPAAAAPHQCASCTEKKKCKGCKKAKKSEYVVKPNFWNPRRC